MRGLWWKLLCSLVIFTAILVTIIMLVNRQLLLQDIKRAQIENRQIIENDILHDMEVVDRAHLYFDTSITEEMEQELSYWRSYYNENPDYLTWDIADIKQRTGMEFYIIDANSVTVRTTYEPSVGFDFKQCCERFVDLLKERRESDLFYSDGLDNSAATKDLWKYGYWSTPDHQYILELGLQVDNTELFKSFNFFDTTERLINEYVDLDEIRIINDEGFFLQTKDNHTNVEMMDARWRAAYEQAVSSLKPVEISEEHKNIQEIHRFVPYTAEVQRGNSTTRIVYMKFNNISEREMLDDYVRQFVFMIAAAVLVSIVLLLIELKILMSTIKLATYDSLTGIYNRASYVQQMDSLVSSAKHAPIGLLLIDLDNFKQINDQFGHGEGDEVLKEVARILKRISKKGQYAVRFGGDEFAIIVEKANVDKIQHISREIISTVKELHLQPNRQYWNILSVSIGGAIQQEPKEEEAKLFERADTALYISKNNGKNQFTLANEEV